MIQLLKFYQNDYSHLSGNKCNNVWIFKKMEINKIKKSFLLPFCFSFFFFLFFITFFAQHHWLLTRSILYYSKIDYSGRFVMADPTEKSRRMREAVTFISRSDDLFSCLPVNTYHCSWRLSRYQDGRLNLEWQGFAFDVCRDWQGESRHLPSKSRLTLDLALFLLRL